VIVPHTAAVTSYSLMVRDLLCTGAPDTGSWDYSKTEPLGGSLDRT
jgi:hypothetical protein